MKGQLCLRCLGCGLIAVIPGGRREAWTYLSPDAQERLADLQGACDGCNGTGRATSDLPALEFLTAMVVNVLGSFSHEGLDDEQRDALDVAYDTAWALWHYYHQNMNPEPLIYEALEKAIQTGRDRLGWHPYKGLMSE